MELLGLQWTDLDWLKRTLIIQRQLTRERNAGPCLPHPSRKQESEPWSLVQKRLKRLERTISTNRSSAKLPERIGKNMV